MYQKKRENDIRCPLEHGLSVFGGKWNSRVLCVLAACGTMRYGEIRRELVNISDAVLAATLRHLIEHCLVSRTEYEEIPPHVEYGLTARGQSVIPILQSICQWADTREWEYDGPVMYQCQKCCSSKKEEEQT